MIDNIEAARAALERGGYLDGGVMVWEAIPILIGDLLYLAESYDKSADEVISEAVSLFDELEPLAEHDGAESYTGWDRIHNDNKAEGRPVGKQWSDEGVYYENGIKAWRR